MKYISKENAIPLAYQEDLEELLFSREFPWFVVNERFNTGKFNTAFSNYLLDDGPSMPKGTTASPLFTNFAPIAYIMSEMLGKEVDKILRVRAGLLLPTMLSTTGLPRHDVDPGDNPHIDFRIPHYTGLYYANDCDGDTVVYNETSPSNEYTELTRSTPERGKIFIFDGKHYHQSNRPKDASGRCVITFNFTVK
jgi:hypothetical protein